MRHEIERPQFMPADEAAPVRRHPFSILVIANLGAGSGAEAGSQPALHRRTPRQVDRDDLDTVMAALAPRIRVPGSGPDDPALQIAPTSVDDLHPDRLLRHIRARVEASDTASSETASSDPPPETAPQGTAPADADPADADLADADPADADPAGGGSLLDRILDDAPEVAGPGEPVTGVPSRADPLGLDLDAYVRQVAARHGEPADDTGADEALDAMDRARARQLRRLLRTPAFAEMEGRWRSLELLCRRLETGPDLKVFVVHATSEDIVEAATNGSLRPWMRQASDELLDGAPWSVAVLDHAFGSSASDLGALEALCTDPGHEEGGTATALLAEADPSLLEVAARTDAPSGPDRRWSRIRTAPGSARVGLLLPRFLIREPWDPGENPIDTLDFQELEPGQAADPGELVWGHPGVLAALCLGLAFRQEGWEMRPGAVNRVRGLPIALHRGPRGVTALPPVEIPLEPSTVSSLVDAGFMPLVGRPGEGEVAVASFRSVAGRALEGPWSAGPGVRTEG